MANKFKVGDRVEIINNGKEYTTYKKWFENNCLKIVNEYENGKEHKNGLKGIIKYIEKHSSCCEDILCAVKIDAGDVVLIGQNGLKLISQPSIHIYPNKTNTNETIAVLKQGKEIVKTAKATCNHTDEYDFDKGADIAVNRLLGITDKIKEVKEVHRKAKPGEYVKILGTLFGSDGAYKKEDVEKYIKDSGNPSVGGGYITSTGTHRWCNCGENTSFVYESEYVVLENYKPTETTKTDLSHISNVELLDEIAKRMGGNK